MTKKPQAAIVNDLATKYPVVTVAQAIDKLKDVDFYWTTRSGVTIAISDMLVFPNKREILNGYERKTATVEKKFHRGKLSAAERRELLVNLREAATAKVGGKVEALYPNDNPIPMIMRSGIVSNVDQIHSLAGMKGMVMNPRDECITRPIETSFREGLPVLEYFNNSYGSRKGLADTVLRTIDSGHLTRRLVSVMQDVIVREGSCGTHDGVVIEIGKDVLDATGSPTGEIRRAEYVETAAIARVLAADVTDAEGNVLTGADTDLNDDHITLALSHGVKEVRVRSVLTCSTATGVCAKCYSRSVATGKLVDIGRAVGIVTAQSTGEPGTQLIMRTFRQDSVGGDITGGLPRVQELFEARVPKNETPLVHEDGHVHLKEDEHFCTLTLILDTNNEDRIVYDKLSKRQDLAEVTVNDRRHVVRDGDHVAKGQQLLKGAADPHEVLEVLGRRGIQRHLIEEVQSAYCDQGVVIHDKHIEIIVSQMLRRVVMSKPGDSDLLPGVLVERSTVMAKDHEIVASGGSVIGDRRVLMGITKASLTTESWLSTTSFRETMRVFTDATIDERSSEPIGLKENMIISKLIPAGTGISRYHNITVEPTGEAVRQAATPFASFGEDFYNAEDTYGTDQVGSAVSLDGIGTFE